MSSPQITLFLDNSSTPRAEAPGNNGFRKKVTLADARSTPDASELETIADTIRENAIAIATELLAQKEAIADATRKAKLAERDAANLRHRRILEYCAEYHPQQVKLIDPRATRVSQKMHDLLRADGYTENEIQNMASRGELIGTAFFSRSTRDFLQMRTETSLTLGQSTNPRSRKARSARYPATAIVEL